MKRGQVTLFIIIGIVLLFIIGIFLLTLNKAETEQITQNTFVEDRNPEMLFIRSQIDYCLNELTKQALIIAGRQGGFIELPTNTLYNSPVSYANNALRFIDGSIIPYSYYVSSSPRCTICNIEDNLPPLSIGQNSIRAQIERYIQQNIEACANLDQFNDQFEISTQTPTAFVSFDDQDTKIRLIWPITVTPYNSQTTITEQYYDNVLNIKFKNMYEVISEVLYFGLVEENMLETFMLNVIRYLSYSDIVPPVDYRQSTSSNPTVYDLSTGFSTLKQELSDNVNMIQVVNSKDYLKPLGFVEPMQNLYESLQIFLFTDFDVLSDIRVRFNYFDSWPTYIAVNPSYGTVAMPRSNPINIAGILNIPRLEYDFAYDVSAPFIVEFEDDSAFNGETTYLFRLAYEANLKNSRPYQTTYGTDLSGITISDTDQRTKELQVNIIDGYTNLPLAGVGVSYNCVEASLALGSSTMQNGVATIKTTVPECIGATIQTMDDNFFSEEILVTEEVMTITAYSKKEIGVTAQKTMMQQRTFTGEAGFLEYEFNVSSLTQSTLLPGEEVSIYFNLVVNGEPTNLFEFVTLTQENKIATMNLVPGEYSLTIMSTLNLSEYNLDGLNYFETQNETIKIDIDSSFFTRAVQAVSNLFRKKQDVEDEFEIASQRFEDTIVMGLYIPEETIIITSEEIRNNDKLTFNYLSFNLEEIIYTRQLMVYGAMVDLDEEVKRRLWPRFE